MYIIKVCAEAEGCIHMHTPACSFPNICMFASVCSTNTPTHHTNLSCTSHKTSATYRKKRAPPMIHQFPLVWWEGDLLTGRVNSRLTHCQHNPRGSLLENLVLWCQVAPHNSPVGLLSVMSHAQCGCVAAERPVITATPCGKAATSNPNKIPSDN